MSVALRCSGGSLPGRTASVKSIVARSARFTTAASASSSAVTIGSRLVPTVRSASLSSRSCPRSGPAPPCIATEHTPSGCPSRPSRHTKVTQAQWPSLGREPALVADQRNTAPQHPPHGRFQEIGVPGVEEVRDVRARSAAGSSPGCSTGSCAHSSQPAVPSTPWRAKPSTPRTRWGDQWRQRHPPQLGQDGDPRGPEIQDPKHPGSAPAGTTPMSSTRHCSRGVRADTAGPGPALARRRSSSGRPCSRSTAGVPTAQCAEGGLRARNRLTSSREHNHRLPVLQTGRPWHPDDLRQGAAEGAG